MKTIERYVFGSFLSSFLLAFLVLSFVMTIGLMVQIVGYILDGVPLSLVGEFTVVCFPETLQWTMPLALLVASVLVFSRLSADSEIAAMRACGINLLTIMKWPLVFAVLCTVLGAVINNEIVPRGHEIRRTLKAKVSVRTGLDILEPGCCIDQFPGVKFSFMRKEGNWLYDLQGTDFSRPGVTTFFSAERAQVTSEGRDVHMNIQRMRLDQSEPGHAPKDCLMTNYFHVVKNALDNPVYNTRDKDLRFFAALAKLRERREAVEKARPYAVVPAAKSFLSTLERNYSSLKTELMKRLVFSFASLCFVLVGIPLGIKAQRKESTVGMAISLAISLVYYMVVVLALGLEGVSWIHPEFIIWLPVVLCLGLSARLVTKNL